MPTPSPRRAPRQRQRPEGEGEVEMEAQNERAMIPERGEEDRRMSSSSSSGGSSSASSSSASSSKRRRSSSLGASSGGGGGGNWLAPLFEDPAKMAALVEELHGQVAAGQAAAAAEGSDAAITHVVGVDDGGMGQGATKRLGAALAGNLQAEFLSLELSAEDEEQGKEGTDRETYVDAATGGRVVIRFPAAPAAAAAAASEEKDAVATAASAAVPAPVDPATEEKENKGTDAATATAGVSPPGKQLAAAAVAEEAKAEAEAKAGAAAAGTVLLCCAWVNTAAHLEAAARLLARRGFRVAACAALRFEANDRTRAFAEGGTKIYAKSWSKGNGPLPAPTAASSAAAAATPTPSSSQRKQQQQRRRRSSTPTTASSSSGATAPATTGKREREGDAAAGPAVPQQPPPTLAEASEEEEGASAGGGSNGKRRKQQRRSLPPPVVTTINEEADVDADVAELESPREFTALTQEEEEQEGGEGKESAVPAAAAAAAAAAIGQEEQEGEPAAPAAPAAAVAAAEAGKFPRPRRGETPTPAAAAAVAESAAASASVRPPLPPRQAPAAASAAAAPMAPPAPPKLSLAHSTSFVEANNPGEDRYANRAPPKHEATLRPGFHAMYSVFDGHGGARASEYAAEVLLPEVIARLEKRPAASSSSPPPRKAPAAASSSSSPTEAGADANDADEAEDEVVAHLRGSFLEVDARFLGLLDPNVTLEEARGHWNAGTCAVLSVVAGSRLYVAHVGDCRAVLGRSARPQPLPSSSSSAGAAAALPMEEESQEEESPDLLAPALMTAASAATAAAAASPAVAAARRTGGDDGGGGTKNFTSKASSSSGNHQQAASAAVAARKSPRRACALSRLAPPPLPVTALPLTKDHTCANSGEVKLVRQRCKDRNPIRLSSKDSHAAQRANGGAAAVAGVHRVAGSLMVTRAIGDAYLKRPNLSFPPYKQFVPYITSEPEITVHELDPTRDRFLILATDGLWERVSNDEAVAIVEKFLHYQAMQADSASSSSSFSSSSSLSAADPDAITTPAAALVEEALARVAAAQQMALRTLKRLGKGGQRRQIHDDICVTVVRFAWT